MRRWPGGPEDVLPELVEEIERVETRFNTVVARRRGRWVDLDVEGATFASWHPDHLLTGYSWDALSAGALLAGEPRSVLMLGLGGGTCFRQLRRLLPNARLVAVELDGGIVELARRHMALGELDIEVALGDADQFLASGTERFDAVIDDLYLSGEDDVVRAGVPEGERLAALLARVSPGGVVVANLISDGAHRALLTRALDAFADAFAEVRVVRPPRGLNEIVVGGKALGDRHRLLAHRDRFALRHDRELWERLSVRKPRAPVAR